MILWRISNYADLLGTGGMGASARWHTAGKPVVYLAESPSSALLEILVHLEVDEEHRPSRYQLLKAEVDDRVSREEIALSDLPPDWDTDEQVTQAGSVANLFRKREDGLNPSGADNVRVQVASF